MTKNQIRKIEGGKCPHFNDGRACRGCEFSADPKRFDPGCFYGHPEMLRAVREDKREQ